jgi:hypothetical protein
MKLIIAGSNGFVATEIIRQTIHNPSITSIIALARRETAVPQDAGVDAAKLKSVVCVDFSNYSEDVKKELAGADGCIWYEMSILCAVCPTAKQTSRTIAVTAPNLKTMPFEDVEKICFDYTATGIENMSPLASKLFRFLYISGFNGERDQTKKPWIMRDYALLRVSSSLSFIHLSL